MEKLVRKIEKDGLVWGGGQFLFLMLFVWKTVTYHRVYKYSYILCKIMLP